MSEAFDGEQEDMVIMGGSVNNNANMKEIYDKMNEEYKTFNKTLNKFMESSHKKTPSNVSSSPQEYHKKLNKKNKTERHTFEEFNESMTYPYK